MCITINEKQPDPEMGAVLDHKTPLLASPPMAEEHEKTPSIASPAKTQEPQQPRLPPWWVWCILLFLFLCLFISYGVVSPSSYYYPKFQVESFSVEPLNVSVANSQITAHWNINFVFTNPYSRGRVVYSVLDALIFYRKEFLGGEFINPFVHQPKETKLVPISVIASSINVSSHIAKDIDAERSSSGAVNFDLQIHANLRFKWVGWEWFLYDLTPYEMWATCENLKVVFVENTTSGSIVPGGERRCDIDWEWDQRYGRLYA